MIDKKVLSEETRNHPVLHLMQKQGIKTVSQLCLRAKLNNSKVGALINGKESPRKKNGSWCLSVEKLADFFGCTPEDLFFDDFHEERLNAELLFGQVSVYHAMCDAEHSLPEKVCEQNELKHLIEVIIGTLSRREEIMIRLTYGIGLNREYSMSEVALMFDVIPPRVMQIVSRALRKIRSPKRSDYLCQFVLGDKKALIAERNILNSRRKGRELFCLSDGN